MKIIDTNISDVKIIEPCSFPDERGFFMETFRESWFREELGLDVSFVQDNHSLSKKGVLRGLHYQIKRPQGKLIRVVAGEIYDVGVDLRKGSPTFGKYVSVRLSSENKKIFWLPPGFAHGFFVLSNVAEIIYKCSDYYFPEFERCIAWNDSQLNVDWPLEEEVFLSEKDKECLLFSDVKLHGI